MVSAQQQQVAEAMSLVKLEPSNIAIVSQNRLLDSPSSSSLRSLDSGVIMEDVKPKIEEISVDVKEWGVEKIQLDLETI
jgi:hypothetical protein